MKCLSMKQPYANLLVSGRKTIELRRWNTKFRGEFLVHASKNIDIDACIFYKIEISTLTKGAIIGKASLIDVKQYKQKYEFDKDRDKHLATKDYSNYKYGFLVKDAIKFGKPIPALGKLGFFDIDFND